MSGKWLGRTLDTYTNTWVHADGSGGAYPDEWRRELDDYLKINMGLKGQAAGALALVEDFKKRSQLVESLVAEHVSIIVATSDPEALFVRENLNELP